MKALLITVLALCSSLSAYAWPTSSQSWSQIIADNSTAFVNMPLATSLGYYGVLNACVAGDNFKSVKPVRVCTKSETKEVVENDGDGGSYTRTETTCVASELRTVTVSRNYQKPVCDKWEEIADGDGGFYWSCTASHNVTATYGTKFDIDVYELKGEDNSPEYSFTKAFEVPACN